MRLSILLIFLSTLSLFAEISYSQQTRISLDMENASLCDILKEIGKKSEFSFWYKNTELNNEQKISLSLKDQTIDKIMEIALQNQDLTYEVKDKVILIFKSVSANQYATQQQRITGKISDANTGEPLPGVYVVIEGTNTGTVTDIEGNFSINIADENSVLTISYIGYISERVEIKGQSIINIALVPDITNLEEVVVVGYGIQKKVNLTGAIASLDGKDLSRRQVAQSTMALQGIAPGVVVTQRSGQPGADGGIISIRGKTTLNNNDALVLVDGVEMGLNNIDASMIESISVLKDAASASIYGSRAANGVILVTTKRAKKDKLSVSYNAYVGWQRPTDLPDIVGAIDHMTLINEAYTNIGSSPLYSDDYIQDYKDNMATNPDLYPDTDWYDLVLNGSGFMQSHFLTMSGGTQKSRIMASLGYLNQDGIMENTNFKRYTLRINTDLEFTESLSAQVDAHIKLANTKVPSRGTSNAIYWCNRMPANQVAILSSGQWGEGWSGYNPVAFTRDGGLKKNEDPSVTLNLVLKYQPLNWLTMDMAYSPNYWQSNYSTFNKSIQTYAWDGSESFSVPQKSTLTSYHHRYLQNNLRSTITMEKEFGSNYFKMLAGYQQEDYLHDYIGGYRETYAFDSYPVLNAGGKDNQESYGSSEEWALQSFFGRINYSFKDKYLFEANYRYDGTSRFLKENRWGGFPSFSAGWRISEEPFFRKWNNMINNLKVRASWGQLGNQNIAGIYPSASVVDLGLSYVIDGEIIDGAAISDLANTELSWETTTVTNVGVDVSLFKKLNLVAEYYYKLTEDILLALDIPLIIGQNPPWQNAGKVENRGWDLGINYIDWNGEFKYEIGFNLSDVKNKVLDIKGISLTDVTVDREGHEMLSIYGLEADGYISDEDYDTEGNYLYATQFGNFAPGDIKYVDQNNDGTIDAKDYKVIGGTIPRFTYGINFNASYKNFDFVMLLQGVGKANGLIYEQGIMPFYTGGTVQEQHKDRWTNENPNPNAKFPRFAFNEINNTKISSFWMKDASYLRFKNIQIGYSFSESVIRKAKLEKLRVYISGQNLFTIDKFWDGYDVEAPVGNGGFYPQERTICLGLDVKF